MPRPNPPRKRPRRSPSAARADAELTRQTAQSTRPQQPTSKSSSGGSGGRGGGGAAATFDPEEMWTRRSYAILIVLIAATEVVIGLILFGLAPQPKDGVSLVAEAIGLQPFQPFPLLAASLLAAPLARRLSGEARPLRFVETLIVGVVIYFIFIIFVTAAGFLLSPQTSGSSTPCTSAVPSPIGNGTAGASASPSGTPCPSPQASASPSASARPSSSAHASATATPAPGSNTVAPGSNLPAAEVLAAAGVCYVAAYALTVFVYPPLYKRLRVRRPPPSGDKK
ncbi:MAG: hypothetical protein JOZ75_10055 [Candidatus Dormibacteraeota bacterium]|nr:hypothetical protein [Candidatus Dormibacteraeota bacterium]